MVLEGVEELQNLQELILDHNEIAVLSQLANHSSLSKLSMLNNSVDDMNEVAVLASIPFLRNLYLAGNPVLENSKEEWNPKTNFPIHSNGAYPPSFRLYISYKISQLTVLDGVGICSEEKVSAQNHYNPPTEVSLSIQHMNHQKLQAKHYAQIRAVDLIRLKRLCPIVLFGPSGVGKRYL